MKAAKPRRVGVLTRHCYPNYGSLLQAYALTAALRQAGSEPVVIDYVPRGDTPLGLAAASLRDSRMNETRTQRITYRMIQAPNFGLMATRFRRYQKQHLGLTSKVSRISDASEVWHGLDAAVAGSDQIWARIHGGLDDTYFLAHAPSTVTRYSYAASLGSAVPDAKDRARVAALARRLDVVSLRESSAAEFMAESDIRARVDVDPVLLHDHAFWSRFAGQPRHTKPYVLVYQLHNTPGFTAVAERTASTHGLPLIRVGVDFKQFTRPGQFHYLCTPSNFVRLFRDATAVVTDSFHGSAFSLIFGRPLYAVAPQQHSTRLSDLFSIFNLQRVLVEPRHAASGFAARPDYDAKMVDERLATIKAPSLAYISRIASGGADHAQEL